jgi:CDP-glucose 4,6-dehydratase
LSGLVAHELSGFRTAPKELGDEPDDIARLLLNCDRANQYLHWNPTWNYPDSITETVTWYRLHEEGADIATVTDSQIEKYCKAWKAAGRD